MTFLMLGGNLDVNVSSWAPGSLFDVRTSGSVIFGAHTARNICFETN